MPYLKKKAAEKVSLPSDPAYYVMWRRDVKYGEAKAAARDLPASKEGDLQSQIARNVASIDLTLLLYIESWNLDDEEGVILPITQASLDQMDGDDIAFLTARLSKEAEQKDDERKN